MFSRVLCHVSLLMAVPDVFQERIAKAHGSQCGFCTPGIVMSMYALLRNNPTPSMADVEEAFHGRLEDASAGQEAHNKRNIAFFFPFQEICVVVPATGPSWRGSRLSPWSDPCSHSPLRNLMPGWQSFFICSRRIK